MCCLVPPFPVPFHYPVSFPLLRWFVGFYPFPLVCFVGVLIADPYVFGLIGFACAYRRMPLPCLVSGLQIGLIYNPARWYILAYNRVFLLPFERNLNYACNLLIYRQIYLELKKTLDKISKCIILWATKTKQIKIF